MESIQYVRFRYMFYTMLSEYCIALYYVVRVLYSLVLYCLGTMWFWYYIVWVLYCRGTTLCVRRDISGHARRARASGIHGQRWRNGNYGNCTLILSMKPFNIHKTVCLFFFTLFPDLKLKPNTTFWSIL